MRRLRYFTFCAVEAVDVLMLNTEGVVKVSPKDRFDTVVFFDRSQEDVAETQRRIPGAIGYPADFVDTVLLDDPDEETLLQGAEEDQLLQDQPDTAKTRSIWRALNQRRDFIHEFPFDLINLDLEEYLFKPSEQVPGKIVSALREVFKWQQQPLRAGTRGLDGFSLMYTARIGPANLGQDYLGMLRDLLDQNLSNHPGLRSCLQSRFGTAEVQRLEKDSFDAFFSLSVPKILAATLKEADWFVDPKSGIEVYEYERPSPAGPYKILHFAMDVNRKDPPREKRAPGIEPPEAVAAYENVVRQLFERESMVVSESCLDQDVLKQSFQRIEGRARKYYSGV